MSTMKEYMPTEAKAELIVIIREWRETLELLKTAGKSHLLPLPDPFSSTIVIEEIEESKLPDSAKALREILPSLPYAKKNLKGRLENLLRKVPQIKATCLTPWGLAKALDLFLFNASESSGLVQTLKPDPESAADYLSQKFFEEPFSRTALVHVYNLKTDQPYLGFGEINTRIMTLTEKDLPLVTGENTFTSTLHYAHAGNCFLVFENSDIEESESWLSDKWTEAWKFITVLKYLKYGVVDIDYSGRFYKPTWVNTIRKYGIDILGRPRWHEQSAPYYLSDEMLPRLHQWIQAKIAIEPTLADVSTDLKRIIDLAGHRYLIHHTKNSLVEQLLDLTIALEALFSPSDQMELSFRISQSVALLLGNDAVEKKEIFDFVRRMYNERSGFVHGGQDPIETKKVTAADIQRLGDLVREAILRLTTLLVRGERSRKDIHDKIVLGAFDSAKSNELRTQSNLEAFLETDFPLSRFR